MTPIKFIGLEEPGLPDRFQSLFFWMTPIKSHWMLGQLDARRVSILVLLDDSHQG